MRYRNANVPCWINIWMVNNLAIKCNHTASIYTYKVRILVNTLSKTSFKLHMHLLIAHEHLIWLALFENSITHTLYNASVVCLNNISCMQCCVNYTEHALLSIAVALLNELVSWFNICVCVSQDACMCTITGNVGYRSMEKQPFRCRCIFPHHAR